MRERLTPVIEVPFLGQTVETAVKPERVTV